MATTNEYFKAIEERDDYALRLKRTADDWAKVARERDAEAMAADVLGAMLEDRSYAVGRMADLADGLGRELSKLDHEVANLKQRLMAAEVRERGLMKLLASLEWANVHPDMDGDVGYRTCPRCAGPDRPDVMGPQGHFADCELAAVLDLWRKRERQEAKHEARISQRDGREVDAGEA